MEISFRSKQRQFRLTDVKLDYLINQVDKFFEKKSVYVNETSTGRCYIIGIIMNFQ